MANVVVTGATRGIGRAICLRFLSEGWNVYGLYSGKTSSDSEIENLSASGAMLIRCDVSSCDSVQTAFSTVYETAGHIDCLVNNAGISYLGLLQDMSVDEWDKIINTNLRSVFLCSRAVLRDMIRSQHGTIVNISSMWGERGASTEVAYSASKGGVNAFTKALAQEVGPSGIRVNALACGAIETSMNAFLSPEEKQDLEATITLGRFGTPDEVAKAVLFLATESSSYLTGQIITLDGGF